MAKFILHGVIVEEPVEKTTTNGVDCIDVILEEKYQTATKERISNYKVTFIGNGTKLIPQGLQLAGSTAVISGTLRSRRYNDNFYCDLIGDSFTLVGVSKPMDVAPETNLDTIELPDDDLPF